MTVISSHQPPQSCNLPCVKLHLGRWSGNHSSVQRDEKHIGWWEILSIVRLMCGLRWARFKAQPQYCQPIGDWYLHSLMQQNGEIERFMLIIHACARCDVIPWIDSPFLFSIEDIPPRIWGHVRCFACTKPLDFIHFYALSVAPSCWFLTSICCLVFWLWWVAKCNNLA